MKKVFIFSIILSIVFCFSMAISKNKKVPQEQFGGGWYCTSGCDVTGVVWNAETTEMKGSQPVAMTIHCNREGSCCTFDKNGVMIWDMDPNCPGPKIQTVPSMPPPSDSTIQVKTPNFNPPDPNNLEVKL